MRRRAPSFWQRLASEGAAFLGLLLNPFFLVQVLRQLLGQMAACVRTLAGGRDRRALPWCAVRLPFAGRWTVERGGMEPHTSHSWDLLSQRYAYDFLVVDERGRTAAQRPQALEDYHAWGRPVLAPVAGVVVRVEDRWPDNAPGRPCRLPLRCRTLLGNHVVIRAPEHGVHVLVAHLQRGSCVHRVGERIAAGDVLGRCGNSGMSTEPHVHLQAQDREDFLSARGLPLAFVGTTADSPNGRLRVWPSEVQGGDVVEPVPPGAMSAAAALPPRIVERHTGATLLSTVLVLLALVVGLATVYHHALQLVLALWLRATA